MLNGLENIALTLLPDAYFHLHLPQSYRWDAVRLMILTLFGDMMMLCIMLMLLLLISNHWRGSSKLMLAKR